MSTVHTGNFLQSARKQMFLVYKKNGLDMPLFPFLPLQKGQLCGSATSIYSTRWHAPPAPHIITYDKRLWQLSAKRTWSWFVRERGHLLSGWGLVSRDTNIKTLCRLKANCVTRHTTPSSVQLEGVAQ